MCILHIAGIKYAPLGILMYKAAARVNVIIAVIDGIIIHLCACISAVKKISQHHRASLGGCHDMCVSSLIYLAVEDLCNGAGTESLDLTRRSLTE